MADNKDLEVIGVTPRKLGTYYRLNASGKASSQGAVTVKHTLSDSFVCLTCLVAYIVDDERHKGCEHTRCVVRYVKEHPDVEHDAPIDASETGAPPVLAGAEDVDEDYA